MLLLRMIISYIDTIFDLVLNFTIFKAASRGKEGYIRSALMVRGIKQHFWVYLLKIIIIDYVSKSLNPNIIL